jgi:hypothetical protein
MLRSHVGLVVIGASVALFLAMLAALEIGWRVGARQVATQSSQQPQGGTVLDSAVYGLLGLLIGFTFSGATTRFDHRRELVGNVVNTTGTAWQRIDALDPEQQDGVRVPFRRYVDALLTSYKIDSIPKDPTREPVSVTQAAGATWAQAVKACLTKEGEQARMLLLPALNEMFGAVEEERLARSIHPPNLIFVIFALTVLAAGFLGGNTLGRAGHRDWIHRVGVALVMSLAVYVILDMEFPRLGLIRIDATDQALVDLRATMK